MIIYFLILNLIYSFEIIDQSKDIFVCENDNANLYVLANDINLSYEWYKDGYKLINYNTPSILIDSPSYSDEGIYKCLISDGNKVISSKPIVLKINPNTEFIYSDKSLYSFDGSSINLHAELTDNSKDQDVNFNWYDLNWNLIADNEIFEGSKSNILSIKLDSNLNKKFFCVVEGQCNTDTSSFNLDYYKFKYPKLITRTICEDSLINFQFILEEINKINMPSIDRIEIFNSKGINLDFAFKVQDNFLEIETNDTMRLNNTGFYSAHVYFQNKVIEFPILDLSVYRKTSLISKSDDFIELLAGQDLNLSINVSGNIQEFEWYKDNLLIETNKSGEFEKKQVTKDDSGIYSCKVKNFCQDSTFFISEVNVKDNSYYLSVQEFKNFQDYILNIFDVTGRSYSLNEFDYNYKNKLYFVLIKKENELRIYKFIYHE